MDALMAAFVAAILAQASDRTPWLTAILSTRFARPGAVIAGTAIALAIINAIGAIGGAIIGPRMTPNAQTLLLALALILAGGSALFPIMPPDRLSGWRIQPPAPQWAQLKVSVELLDALVLFTSLLRENVREDLTALWNEIHEEDAE